MICPHCLRPIESAAECPYCHTAAPSPAEARKTPSTSPRFAAFWLGIVALCAGIGLFQSCFSTAPAPAPPSEKTLRPVDTVRRMRGFQALTEPEQTALLRYISGNNPELSAPARDALNQILSRPNVDTNRPDLFRKFLRERPGLPENVTGFTYTASELPAYTLSTKRAVDQFAFVSGETEAQEYELVFSQQTIRIIEARRRDSKYGYYHTVQEVAKALAIVPEKLRAYVAEVRLEPKPNPADSYWRKKYRGLGRAFDASYMTSGADRIVSVYPSQMELREQEMIESLIHEVGHIVSESRWSENSKRPAWEEWKTAMQKDGLFASKYAKASPEEDFAETTLLYYQVLGKSYERELRRLLPARFEILDRIHREPLPPPLSHILPAIPLPKRDRKPLLSVSADQFLRSRQTALSHTPFRTM